MLSISASIRVFIYGTPVGFRKSHDGMSGTVRRDLEKKLLGGVLFAP